ncbi:MAG: zf-TFIIB domain-containing protein [Candidatus Levybacteria bacterium]|nr:zf-TFIIB domain-containing protein [Candidatus Levybacteria bacterium]
MKTCPSCGSNLKQKNYNGVRIDECERCNGMWFDKDELRRAKDATDDDLRWLDFDLFEKKEGKFSAIKTDKKCPSCSSQMQSLQYMDSKVTIDVCPSCNGVWLDNNELKKIVQYLENIVVSKTSSEYTGDMAKQFQEIITGPESTASELKDFLAVVRLFDQRLLAENHWLSDIITYWPIR